MIAEDGSRRCLGDDRGFQGPDVKLFPLGCTCSVGAVLGLWGLRLVCGGPGAVSSLTAETASLMAKKVRHDAEDF